MSKGNEPAYGFAATHGIHDCSPGLTKRELFAAMAMQGLCSNQLTFKRDGVTDEEIARWSVQQADALLDALERTA